MTLDEIHRTINRRGYVFLLDNLVVYCSFFVLSAVCLAAAGSSCAEPKRSPIGDVINCLRSWPCRSDAPNESNLPKRVIEVVIVLSDSDNGTGERRETAAYCQCEGAERGSRIVTDGTKTQVQEVSSHVHGFVSQYTYLHVSLLETGFHANNSLRQLHVLIVGRPRGNGESTEREGCSRTVVCEEIQGCYNHTQTD